MVCSGFDWWTSTSMDDYNKVTEPLIDYPKSYQGLLSKDTDEIYHRYVGILLLLKYHLAPIRVEPDRLQPVIWVGKRGECVTDWSARLGFLHVFIIFHQILTWKGGLGNILAWVLVRTSLQMWETKCTNLSLVTMDHAWICWTQDITWSSQTRGRDTIYWKIESV